MKPGRCHDLDDGEGLLLSEGNSRRKLGALTVAPSNTDAVVARVKARYEEIRRHAHHVDLQLQVSKRLIHGQAIRNRKFVSVLERFEREINIERRGLAAEQSRLSVVSESTAYLLAQWLRRIRIRFAPTGTLRDRIVMN